MRFATILALAGLASAKTITEYVTATADVPCTTSSATWTQGVTTITVIVPPGNATATWASNSSTKATGYSSPTGDSSPPEVTGAAVAMKASVAGLLGFAGAALLVL
ncbi:Fc.00g015820.m01.CDS01 [Cosmosporella sp. VM-42]